MARFAFPTLLILIFVGYFSIQVCPTFYYWDSAELTAAVIADGVPHPPGFPLLLILGKIFLALVPFNKGLALNLLSALFGVIGLALWYFVIRTVLELYSDKLHRIASDLISFLATIVLGTSFAFSIQAVRFEVYSLSFAFFALIFLMALLVYKSEKGATGRVLILAAAVGLALGTHILTIILALPGIVLLLYMSRRVKVSQFLLAASISFLLAFISYGYIYLLARHQPVLNWGDPSDLRRFFDYMTAREFTTSISSFNLGHVVANVVFAINLMIRQFGLPAILLSIWGLYGLVRHKGRIGYPLLLILVLNVFSIIFSESFYYDNYDQLGYLVISLAVMALSGAAGLWLLYGLLKGLIKGSETRLFGNPAVYVTVVVAALIYAYPLRTNTFAADLSDVHGADQYAADFLSGAPDGAVMITSYYNTYFCLLAEQVVSGRSANHTVVNLYNWDHGWGKEATARLFGKDLDVNADRQTFYRNFLNGLMKDVPIYVEYDESSAPLAKYLLPDGLGYILTSPDTSVISTASVTAEIEDRQAALAGKRDAETIRTWVYWFQNRGLFLQQRGYPDLAEVCFAAVESLSVSQRR